jgi:hypothetical protein
VRVGITAKRFKECARVLTPGITPLSDRPEWA